jgi:hypothetical protein
MKGAKGAAPAFLVFSQLRIQKGFSAVIFDVGILKDFTIDGYTQTLDSYTSGLGGKTCEPISRLMTA